MDLDFDLLPLDDLQAEVCRERDRELAMRRDLAVPAGLLEDLLTRLPTVSDYDHRCWCCGAEFRRQLHLARDPVQHAGTCAWAQAWRLLDEHVTIAPGQQRS